MAFPTLSPDGKGNPTNPSLNRDVQFDERIKHLLESAEKENGTWLYHFASHPRFAYWALNMIQRKRILQQTGIFETESRTGTSYNRRPAPNGS